MKSVLIITLKEDDVRLIRESLPSDYLVENADSVKIALELHRQSSFDVIFSDITVLCDYSRTKPIAETIKRFKETNPLAEILILSSKASIQDTVKAVKAGAQAYLTYPVDPAEVRLAIKSVNESLTKNLELDYLRDQFWKPEWLDIIKSRNVGMREVYKKIRSVAPTRATVLLIGETGTGKGLLARMLHMHSNRCDDPFINVHCGAIPDTLLESELFGHEKGAFTGAVQRKLGKFEMARGGTIFLDEIGTITPSAQIKLLQVLQDGNFSRVGGEQILNTDARVIAATNADLGAMSERGEFRKDRVAIPGAYVVVVAGPGSSIRGRAFAKKSIHWIDFFRSPTADGVNDFDLVAFPDWVLREGAAGNQFFVDFDGDPLSRQLEGLDEIGKREAAGQFAGFAVDGDLHGARGQQVQQNRILH